MELSVKAAHVAYQPAPRPKAEAGGRQTTVQLLVWVAAFALFGFGDTLTSLLVFGKDGAEANVLLGAVLNFLGPTVQNFLIVKTVTTAVPVLLARLSPKLELVISLAMLATGLFLVGQNLAALLLT